VDGSATAFILSHFQTEDGGIAARSPSSAVWGLRWDSSAYDKLDSDILAFDDHVIHFRTRVVF